MYFTSPKSIAASACLRCIVSCIISLAAVTIFGTDVVAQEVRGFHAKGAQVSLEQMPMGKLRRDLEALSFGARQSALQRLGGMQFPWEDTIQHLRANAAGKLFYEDNFAVPRDRRPRSQPSTKSSGSVAEAAIPINIATVFSLHSKPGAPRKVYLNFRGETVSGTAWNAASGFVHPMKPYSLDGDLAGTSQQEANVIAEVWKNVSEDLAPFDIDVTTERPASFGPQTGHILISPKMDANGRYIYPYDAGGVAFLDVWGQSDFTYYQPALVFPEGFWTAKDISEAASHELGHNLSLSHDGRTVPSEAYFDGHGTGNTSWGPIMGTTYTRNVSQWSKGEYAYANNAEDDIALIASRLALRADDHANALAGATALVSLNGVVSALTLPDNPANSSPSNKGIINSRSDIDVFYFDAAVSGTVSLKVRPDWLDTFTVNDERAANLDVVARLYNSAGGLLAQAYAPGDTDAQLSVAVSPGRYFLAIDGGGAGSVINDGYSDYGSVGRFYIEGTIPVPKAGLVQFGAPAYSISEGTASVSLTLTRSTGTSSGSVNYATSNVSAASGTDYTGKIGSVSFAAGETSKVITVPIIDDAVSESPESFKVSLSNPIGVGLGNPSAATVTISDNDTPSYVAFSAASYTVTEGTASVSVTLTRSSAIGPGSVNYATANATAVHGSDYTGKIGSVVFAAGETSKVITVPILNDAVSEGPESFRISISNPIGVVLGSPGTATVNINDNDVAVPTVAFGAATYTVAERTASVSLTLTRSSGAGTGSVNYTTANGTAVHGSDYTGKVGSIIFAAGETSKVITVPILNDAVSEGPENFRMSISNPIGVTLGSASAATVTINDDDAPGNVVVLKNGVQLSGLSGAAASVRYFAITLPAGAADLAISTSGGTGDADLYVRYGSLPTLSGFDCSPLLSGNAETCSSSAPNPGTYYIMVYGYSAYSSMSLTASYAVTTPLSNGVAAVGISGAVNSQRLYSIKVPTGAVNLQIATSGGAGDADLYVKLNELPDSSIWDCRPYLPGNAESCSWPSPTPGIYYILLDGYDAYSSVTLLASYGGAAAANTRKPLLVAGGVGAPK